MLVVCTKFLLTSQAHSDHSLVVTYLNVLLSYHLKRIICSISLFTYLFSIIFHELSPNFEHIIMSASLFLTVTLKVT